MKLMHAATKRTKGARPRAAALAARALPVLALVIAASYAEASVPRVTLEHDGVAVAPLGENALAGAPREVASLRSLTAALAAPAAADGTSLADSRFSLFTGDEVALAPTSRVHEFRLDLHQELELLAVEPLRGPPLRSPETRIGGSGRFLGARMGEEPRLTLNLRWACGLSGCELVSEKPQDPLGLMSAREAYINARQNVVGFVQAVQEADAMEGAELSPSTRVAIGQAGASASAIYKPMSHVTAAAVTTFSGVGSGGGIVGGGQAGAVYGATQKVVENALYGDRPLTQGVASSTAGGAVGGATIGAAGSLAGAVAETPLGQRVTAATVESKLGQAIRSAWNSLFGSESTSITPEGGWNAPPPPSPYAHLKDPKNVGVKPFTKRQHREGLAANRAANNGVLRSDKSGRILDPPTQSRAGVTPSPNEAQLDHCVPIDACGTNSYRNLQILARDENITKSNKPDGLP